MAPVLWGLNLGDMQWNAFKASNMFTRDYHLRRSKMIVYQIAMTFCVISESIGTDALTAYADQQKIVERYQPGTYIHNDDFIGIASFNIFQGVYVATIFGAAFFFDLFWPERQESRAVRTAWKICAALACVMGLADAIAFTVIVASHTARVTGLDASSAQDLMATLTALDSQNPPLAYKHNHLAIASIVFLWFGWVATVASTFILFKSHAHDEEFGPKSAHTLREEEEKGRVGTTASVNGYTGPDRNYDNYRDPNFMASELDGPEALMTAQMAAQNRRMPSQRVQRGRSLGRADGGHLGGRLGSNLP